MSMKYGKTNHLRKKTIKAFIFIFLLTYIVKSYKIENGKYVVWDEAHFGKFGSKYLKREFYFDVHPPLGKMLTALSGYIFGQDKDFKFESGAKYPDNMDYVGMRRFHAVLGSFIPVFGFGIMRELGYKSLYSFLIALLFIFENGFGSISRLILLDSHLLFFTGSTIYFLVRFYNNNDMLSCALLGMSIGCVMSVKWIGCLTTLLVGLYIIAELWSKLMSNYKISRFCMMFAMRAAMLIFVPILLYVVFFLLHFMICNKSTSDEAHMSSLFQATLQNSKMSRLRKYVTFGSIVTIKASKIAGGNLHSHVSTYPNSKHKQITTYFHKDENNHYAFQKAVDDGENADYLHDGDDVVLMHLQTKSYLSIDNHNAYMSKGNRVIGVTGQILKSCVWIVELVDDYIKKENRIKTISTRFRLKNKETGYYLNWSGKNYPEWGFKQGEVTCVEDKDVGTVWNIEENKLEEDDEHEEYKEIKNLKTSFLTHVIELNKAMFISNNALTQDVDIEPPIIVSKPYEWFILRRGLRMCNWDDTNVKFYMFGNPVIWLTSSVCIILTPIICLIKVIACKRSGKQYSKKEIFEVYVLFFGWAIHYLPFFIIGRVLYFHHYFPALFFAILSIGYVFKHLPIRFLVLFTIIAITCFFYYSQLTYGINGPSKELINKKVISTWDFA
ncbi:Protein O-mannosyltransferase 2 [Binucleata daphniae]